MTELTHMGKKSHINNPKVLPIYLSSVFSFDDIETLDKIYNGEEKGYIYSRINNPIYDSLSEIMVSIEGGEACRVYSTGMAAITTTILSHVKQGDHIIADSVLYGGTLQFFKEELSRFGIEVSFIDFRKDDIEKHFKENTKIVYTETISNPLMEVTDIERIAKISHKYNAKLVIDNTFATPIICQPLKLGADIVIHSATKYTSGHSDVMGGIVVSDSDTIDKIGKIGTIYGASLSPFDGWLLIRSLRTLELRVKRHSENAIKLARYFENNKKIKRVYYPGLESFPYHNMAKKIFSNEIFGGMLSIEIEGGYETVNKLIQALKEVKFVPSLASYDTTVSYPAKTSHRNMNKEDRQRIGITDGLLRISVGLENIDDIIEQFEKALQKL
ncbi:cystathionine gamma-synthase [Thermohalobacter berrensis]|uniref:homocysteine desulfhydrase n=2 Tax=Thermohalobacter berrensis TaxID=99594 RepID=A0A419SVC1_9FIRM|nr:cystathionine gamma-synthase [Thermohalobacter berrensis]